MDLSEQRGATVVRHPWEVARARAIETILRRHQSRFSAILDYGCGDGYTGEQVQDRFEVERLVELDVHLPPAACGIEARDSGSVERARDPAVLAGRRFDLVLLCDVLEHVEDDAGMLESLVSAHLAPGGLVMITVPAFQSLFSEHDRFLKHYRRYRLAELRGIVVRAGLAVAEDGYLFGSLLPARVAALALSDRPAESGEHGIGGWDGGPWLTRLVTAALRCDTAVMLGARRVGVTLPGLSAWVLCRAS